MASATSLHKHVLIWPTLVGVKCFFIKAGLISRQDYAPEKAAQLEHKIPIYNSDFLGVMGLTSSYVVYDYTTSGYMDL